MIHFGLKSEQQYIIYGNREDVCELCLREEIEKEREEGKKVANRITATRALAGQQAAQPLFKVPLSGLEPVFICTKHMKELADAMEKAPKGEA